MVSIQHEKPVMIECRGFPLFHTMALLAVALYLTMEVIFRFSMATITLQTRIACQQIMVESRALPGIGGVALVAGYGRQHVFVKIIVGPCVATIAFRPDIPFDKRMRKRLATVAGQPWSDMVAMAGNTILHEQLLVKRDL